MRYSRLIVIGFFLVLLGAVLPFLMVLRLIESTLLLNFVAFSASVAGLFLGVIGMATYVGEKRRRRQDEWYE
jgi:membrane associated rhomboid family serine protease